MRAALRAQSFLFNGAAACVHNADNRELDAILEYLKQLKGRCVAKAETYGERKARRDAELAGLHEALEILENQAALVQTSERRSLRHAKLHVA